MHRYKVALLILTMGLAGCQRYAPIVDTTSINQLAALNKGKGGTQEVSEMRFAALRDVALSIGARGGLAARSKKVNRYLISQERTLDRIFNFTPLMLDDNVMPPVLIEARNTLEQSSGDSLRFSDRIYNIYSQARFVTAAPIWQDYLIMQFETPLPPDRSLLPRNGTEQGIWQEYIYKGWQAGLHQADNIFNENIGRLQRDMNGMIRYRILLAQNMVSQPFVAKVDMGITGGGSEMAVNDRVLKITAHPALQAQGNDWKTEISR